MNVLEIENLRRMFRSPEGGEHVVIDIERFALAEGEQAALAGGSGGGKTTLLNLIAGILSADAGAIRVAGRDIVTMTESQRDRWRAEHVGYVFQTFNLLQGYTALENVELGMMFGAGLDRGRAIALLERVGMADRTGYKPRQLSVGQQQRVAVARALANQPKLVLADEPTGNLDTALADESMRLIRQVCQESGAALLVVTHDPRMLEQFETVHQLARINRAGRASPVRGGAT